MSLEYYVVLGVFECKTQSLVLKMILMVTGGAQYIWLMLKPFKPNGFVHPHYLEESILHFKGCQVDLFFISLT